MEADSTLFKASMMNSWQQWLHHPERSRTRQVLFQMHLWIGAMLSAYVLWMSLTGSVLVFRNEFPPTYSLEWLARLHADLGAGATGRFVNGVAAIGLLLLCLTGAIVWWPGVGHWRRTLTVNWRAKFPRISWDLHSALGFWFFLFVFEWAVSAIYFAFPHLFDFFLVFDCKDHFTDTALYWLANLHFGRFGWFGETAWGVIGLVPAVLGFTGVFICCRRMIYQKPSNPNAAFHSTYVP